jgi:hypothetical protein
MHTPFRDDEASVFAQLPPYHRPQRDTYRQVQDLDVHWMGNIAQLVRHGGWWMPSQRGWVDQKNTRKAWTRSPDSMYHYHRVSRIVPAKNLQPNRRYRAVAAQS